MSLGALGCAWVLKTRERRREDSSSSSDDASKLHHEHESRFFRGLMTLQSCVCGSAG